MLYFHVSIQVHTSKPLYTQNIIILEEAKTHTTEVAKAQTPLSNSQKHECRCSITVLTLLMVKFFWSTFYSHFLNYLIYTKCPNCPLCSVKLLLEKQVYRTLICCHNLIHSPHQTKGSRLLVVQYSITTQN